MGNKKQRKSLKEIVNQQIESGVNHSDYNNRASKSGGDNEEEDNNGGINTKSIAYILTKKYARLQNRVSILDSQDPNSLLNKSIFKGFNNLIAAFGTIMIVAYPILRYIKHGQVFNDNLYNNMSKDIWVVVCTWPLFYCWAYTALVLQKFIIWGLNKNIAIFLQHSTQSMMFIYSLYMTIYKDWCTSHTGFITMLSCTHFMKMHSYTVINKDYRDDYLDAKKKGYKALSSYPNNINFKDFTRYMWAPVLVYQDDFPSTKTFRVWYFIQKVIQFSIGFVACYVLLSDYLSPYVDLMDKISAFELFCHSLIPLFITTIIIFYIVWDCMCNAFAELAYYGDRYFYRDWWNSTTFEEFNSKWNRCVYNFLFRHVYLEAFYRYKFSKKMAQFLTFFFSALLHEWIMMLIFKIFRPFMTFMMLQQIPLFYFTSNLYKTRGGNLFMWFGLCMGFPLIAIVYLKGGDDISQLYSSTSNQ